MTFVHPLSLRSLRGHFVAQREAAHAELLSKVVRSGAGADLFAAIRDDVLADDWADFARTAQLRWWAQREGSIYVAVNAMNPSFFKVGMTRGTAQSRVEGLSNEAVLGSFVLVEAWRVYDRHWLEAAAHQALAHLPRHKEFFVGAWDDIVARTDAVITADRQLFDSCAMLPTETAAP